MKNICLFSLLFLSPVFLFSQTPKCDTLIMQDGKVMVVKIESRNEREIIYSGCEGKSDKQYMVYTTSVREIRSAKSLASQKEQRRRLNSIYVAPSLYADLYNVSIGGDTESFFGASIFYDCQIHSFSEKVYLGFSAGLGFVDGSGSFDDGPLMRLGPKLFVGSKRQMFTAETLYFFFQDGGDFNYNGLVIGGGYALTGKSGFFFHPKINFLSSFNEAEKDNKVQFFEIQLGVGYSF